MQSCNTSDKLPSSKDSVIITSEVLSQRTSPSFLIPKPQTGRNTIKTINPSEFIAIPESQIPQSFLQASQSKTGNSLAVKTEISTKQIYKLN